MPRYVLDADTCSSIMKRSSPIVLRRLQAVPVTDVCTSVVTKSELLHGAEVSPRLVALRTPPPSSLPIRRKR